MFQSASELVEAAVEDLLASANGNLQFGFRLAIRRTLDKLYPGEWRYAKLCIESAREILPNWKTLGIGEDLGSMPETMLALADQCILSGGQDRHRLIREFQRLSSNRDAATAASARAMHSHRPCFACEAAFAAASAALNYPSDSIYDLNDRDEDIDPELLDTQAYVAMEYAGSLWEFDSDANARRDFWLRWLTESVRNSMSR
jgi:hypothetical protein